MSEVHIGGMDLNLLRLFHRIYAAKSVSGGAARLGLTQSAASHGLARLRALFDDALFVRAGLTLVPTARADALFIPIQSMLEIFEDQIARPVSFDPLRQAHTFSLAMSDMAEVVFLPLLIQRLRSAAPRCTLHVKRLQTRRVADALDRGDAELAIGVFPDPPPHLYRQTLYEQNYVVIAWDRHPRLRTRLTWAAYEKAEHVISFTGADKYFEETILAPMGIRRRARVSIEGSLSIPWLLRGTDLIATIPARLDEDLAGAAAIRQFSLPSHTPPYPLQSIWHPRLHNEPAHRWLREAIFAWVHGPGTAAGPRDGSH